MGNSITYASRPDLQSLYVSNGHTSVLMDLLALASSALATTEDQVVVARWLAGRDQGAFGLGMVGFDVSELPWGDTPESIRAFLLASIERACTQDDWPRLDYEPQWPGMVEESLQTIRVLIEEFSTGETTSSPDAIWPWGGPGGAAGWCARHQIYEHVDGCRLCR